MRKVFYFAAVAFSAIGLLAACSDSTDDNTSSSSSGTSGTTSGDLDSGIDAADAADATPAPPTLGAQIDRFGRPAVNTALNHVFLGDTDPTKGPAKDAYNANSDPSTWATMYATEFAANLAGFDSLDGNCGNQAFASTTADANQYNTLAGVLADDRQYLNTASTTCTQYLGVELNATKVITNSDCGGRKFTYDVIKLTYNILVTGNPAGTITDGTTAVAAKTDGTTFPYFEPATQ